MPPAKSLLERPAVAVAEPDDGLPKARPGSNRRPDLPLALPRDVQRGGPPALVPKLEVEMGAVATGRVLVASTGGCPTAEHEFDQGALDGSLGERLEVS
jgi:hypothetical protein